MVTADTPPSLRHRPALSQVWLFQGLTQLGTTSADGNGNWNFADTTDTLQTVNLYSFAALAADIAGNVERRLGGLLVTAIAPP